MKKLDFNPYKSTEAFRKNYKLHDLAEMYGKNLLIQWGFNYSEFGKDLRYNKVWEKGKDKPDLMIEYKGKKALLDWKGKHKSVWLVNERAYNSYNEWRKKLKIPVFICFAVFDDEGNLLEFRFCSVGKHSYLVSKEKEWDKNATVELELDIPKFTKPNVLAFLTP